VKSAHDHRMLPQRRPVLANLAWAEAADHGFDQRLLETASGLRTGNDLGCVFRQLSNNLV
jgi:hypothetical protein